MKRLLTRLIWFAAGLTAFGLAAGEVDWNQRLGIAERRGELVCLVTAAAVEAGQAIHLISPFEPQVVTEAEIAEVDSAECREASEALLPGEFHRLEPPHLEALSRLNIAILDHQIPVAVSDGEVRADLDRDGAQESFRACTSREGVHLTIWSGRPLAGQRRWHQYYYLGYDVEPTCDERDYRGSAGSP